MLTQKSMNEYEMDGAVAQHFDLAWWTRRMASVFT